MKYAIEGFSQEYAMTLKKEVDTNGKTITRKIDCTDLVILRWFVDFYPNMKKIEVDGKQYAWLTHGKLIEDLPLIDISKKAFIERMQKLVEFDILEYQFIKDGGTFSLYGFGRNYGHLIGRVGVQTDTGGRRSNGYGVGVQTDTKDKSIIDKSTIDIKKERKTTYDAIVQASGFDDTVQQSLYEFIKMRKLIKKPLTDRALTNIISRLKNLSGGVNEMADKILNQSIDNNWQGLYELKVDKQEEVQQNGNELWSMLVDAVNKIKNTYEQEYNGSCYGTPLYQLKDKSRCKPIYEKLPQAVKKAVDFGTFVLYGGLDEKAMTVERNRFLKVLGSRSN